MAGRKSHARSQTTFKVGCLAASKFIAVLFLAAIAVIPPQTAKPALGATFTTLVDPLASLASFGTRAQAISGNNIVGTYGNSSGTYGFLYDGSTFTTLTDPLNASILFPGNPFLKLNTFASGISGSHIVGQYASTHHSQAYLYDGSTWTTLLDPLGINGGQAWGIDGNNTVGFYKDASNNQHGFLYNGSTYKTLDNPLAVNGTGPVSGTIATAISGNNIVGYYSDAAKIQHGFLYNGSTYTTLDDPLGTQGTEAFGVDGKNVVGSYTDAGGHEHGFFYNGSAFTTLDNPIGNDTIAFGISGMTVVGSYFLDPASGPPDQQYGFMTVVPEPSTLVLAALGLGGLVAMRWRRRFR